VGKVSEQGQLDPLDALITTMTFGVNRGFFRPRLWMHNENSDFLASTSHPYDIASTHGPKNKSSENARETRSQKAGGKSRASSKDAGARAEEERQKTGSESQPQG
jgi:hypothetical protein